MFIRTQRLQATRALIEKVLAALVVAVPAAILDVTAKIQLYKAGPTPDQNVVLTDYTACDFTGYAEVVLASALGPVNFPGGEGLHKEADFTCSAADPTKVQSALGMMLVAGDGTTLLAVEQFPTGVPMNAAHDTLSYDLILAPFSVWGGEQGA